MMKFQLERRRPSRGHLHRPVSRRKRLDTRVRRIQPIIVRAIESQTSSERFKQDVARRQPLPAYVRQGPLPLQQKKRRIRWNFCALLTIAVDVLNIAEQFGVFFQLRNDNQKEIRFLLFQTALSAFVLLKYFTTNLRLRLILSIFADLIEFVVYWTTLDRNASLYSITVTFASTEVLLNIFNFILIGSTDNSFDFWQKLIDFGVHGVLFLFSNAIPFMTLFFRYETQFRRAYFECLLIIYLFFGNTGIEILSEISTFYLRPYFPGGTPRQNSMINRKTTLDYSRILQEEAFLVRCYCWAKFCVAIIINYSTVPILIFIISAVETSRRKNDERRYDRNAYIVLVSVLSAYFLLLPFFIYLFWKFLSGFRRDSKQERRQLREDIASIAQDFPYDGFFSWST